ncbi:hypothetical protein KGF57_005080 [Candida theae]|uniref:Suppressor of forked domain-containing protein n=1 Tax=Candida theae TaxID=1198502 RepID=A0AAD5B9R7_9ASCO|nr:uncharacterized protein KGF57_005080 [Candida theae]KAI5948887.1 hypothetical protein KGF57_005080 [Candida theae]
MSRPKKWTDVSIELIKDPDNFELWQQLITSAEYNDKNGISKSTPQSQLQTLRTSYDRFLAKYPFMYKYWIRYAEWEFKLTDLDAAIKIYDDAFQHLECCIELWVNYLQFRINTITNNVDQVLNLFEKARRLIGCHFYSYEFYTLYLSFLESYATDTNQFKRKYYTLLRIILEVPLYHYEYFYKKYFELISRIGNDAKLQSDLPYIVPAKELQRQTKNLSQELKKTFTDAYITIQHKVYELYHFEKRFKRHHNDIRLISRQQLDAWLQYFDFLQLQKYPQSYIEMNYWRYLYIAANYPESWQKFADYFVFYKKFNSARHILIRGWKYLGNHQILIKLIDLEIFLKQYLRAKELIVEYVKYNVSIPVAIHEKLISIERIFNENDDDHMLNIFKSIIQDTQNDWFFNVLNYYSIDKDKKMVFLAEMKEFKGQKYYDTAMKLVSEKGKEDQEKSPNFNQLYKQLLYSSS